MKKMIKKLLILTLLVGVMFSCKKDNDEVIPDGEGAVAVKLTDAPFPFSFVTDASIGITKIELKSSEGVYTTVFEGSAEYNMIGLTNGVTVDVETTNVEAGTYVEARVTLSSASVHLANGTEFNLDAAASAQSYTVLIEPNLIVEEGETSNLLFDLDINDSFEFSGLGGLPFSDWISSIDLILNCGFDADFRVCDLDQTGSISGTVTVSGNPAENVYVSVTINGDRIATHTEADGTYTFIGVKEGEYTVQVQVEGNEGTYSNSVTINANETGTCDITIE